MTFKYPGSKMSVKTFEAGKDSKAPRSIDEYTEDALGEPKIYLVKGVPTKFYGVGVLARALNRKPVTIRKWESQGIIPQATFILPGVDERGRRRLYSKDQVLGLRKLADEERLIEPNANGRWKKIEDTKFKERALNLFKELEGK